MADVLVDYAKRSKYMSACDDTAGLSLPSEDTLRVASLKDSLERAEHAYDCAVDWGVDHVQRQLQEERPELRAEIQRRIDELHASEKHLHKLHDDIFAWAPPTSRHRYIRAKALDDIEDKIAAIPPLRSSELEWLRCKPMLVTEAAALDHIAGLKAKMDRCIKALDAASEASRADDTEWIKELAKSLNLEEPT